MRTGIVAWMALASTLASVGQGAAAAPSSGMLPMNVLVQALEQGEASGPLPDDPALAPMIRRLQEQAGTPGDIELKAKRVVRFTQQPRCGRVMFGVWQPASNKAWPALGGAVNLCEDSQPPLRACAAQPKVLVPATTRCADQSAPQDTAEVAAAIKASLDAGGVSATQAREAVRAATQADSPTGSAPGIGR